MTCSIACQREWPVLNQLSGYRRRVWSKECRTYLAPPIIMMGDGWNLAQFLTFPPFHVIDPPCPVLFALLYLPVAVVPAMYRDAALQSQERLYPLSAFSRSLVRRQDQCDHLLRRRLLAGQNAVRTGAAPGRCVAAAAGGSLWPVSAGSGACWPGEPAARRGLEAPAG